MTFLGADYLYPFTLESRNNDITGLNRNFRAVTVKGGAHQFIVTVGLSPDGGTEALASRLRAHMERHGSTIPFDFPMPIQSEGNPGVEYWNSVPNIHTNSALEVGDTSIPLRIFTYTRADPLTVPAGTIFSFLLKDKLYSLAEDLVIPASDTSQGQRYITAKINPGLRRAIAKNKTFIGNPSMLAVWAPESLHISSWSSKYVRPIITVQEYFT